MTDDEVRIRARAKAALRLAAIERLAEHRAARRASLRRLRHTALIELELSAEFRMKRLQYLHVASYALAELRVINTTATIEGA